MKNSGFKREPLKLKDWSHEKVFGAAIPEKIVPLGRYEKVKTLNLPVVYQGDAPSCIHCSVVWLKQWSEATGNALSIDWLVDLAPLSAQGTTPSAVLNAARRDGICSESKYHSPEAPLDALSHRTGNNFFLSKYDKDTIYAALKISPLLVGIENYQGVGDHMMIAVDVDETGENLICANWWNATEQMYVSVPFSSPIVFACSVAELPQSMSKSELKFGIAEIISSKLFHHIPANWKQLIVAVLTVLLGSTAVVTSQDQPKNQFGASGVVGAYRTSLSSGQNSTQNTLTVSSRTLVTGETFTDTDLIFPIYLTVNPGGGPSGTEETQECWGFNSGTLTFTSCGRAISYLGGNTTSSVSGRNFPHAAGETVIMANIPAFYNRFMDRYTNQSATGTKSWTADTMNLGSGSTAITRKFVWEAGLGSANPFLYQSGTSTIGFSPDGVSTFPFNSAGTVVAASSTRGIFITDGLIGINTFTSSGLKFRSDGKVYVATSTVPGGGALAIDDNGLFLNASTTSFSGLQFMTGASSGTLEFSGAVNFLNVLGYVSASSTSATSTFGHLQMSGNLVAPTILASSTVSNATTTLTGNLQITGSINATGKSYLGTSAAGTFSRNFATADGTVTYTHNLGVIPNTINITCYGGFTAGNDYFWTSSGYANASSQVVTGGLKEPDAGQVYTLISSSNVITVIANSAGGTGEVGTIGNITANSFDITYTETAAQAVTMNCAYIVAR